MTDEPLEERLGGEAGLPPMDAGFGANLLAATTRRVRQRRRRRQALQVAAISLAFVAGMFAMLPARTSRGPGVADHQRKTVETGDNVTVANPEETNAELFADPEALAFAYDATDDAGKLRLLKGAGDYELNVNQDVRAALDYYRQWIVLADATTRDQYDETDTWLLASLKHSPR